MGRGNLSYLVFLCPGAWYLWLILENFRPLCLQIFLLFHSHPFYFLGFQLRISNWIYVWSFYITPQNLYLHVCFILFGFSFLSFFSIRVTIWVISVETLNPLILSSAIPDLLLSLWKALFISVTVFFNSSVSIWFSLMVSNSLLKFSIQSYMIFIFPTEAFNTLIIVILKCLSDSTNNLSLVLLIGKVLFFGGVRPYYFLLKVRPLMKGNSLR